VRNVSDPRCPSSVCGRQFRDAPRSLLDPDVPRPAWLDSLIAGQGPEHSTDLAFRCPHCGIVWTQPGSALVGFSAVLRGYDRGDPERLEPVPPGVRAVDPPARRVAERPNRQPHRRR
jgi:hypothetical protein